MKYRKKPIVIEAIQWTGLNINEIDKSFPALRRVPMSQTAPGCFGIQTLEGNMMASIGDWIIKGVQGEFYPCKPDIFKETYDKASE